MTTLYPGSIDGYSQIRILTDRVNEIVVKDHNDLRSAVISIEQTLGINPQGAFGTVVARLNDAYGNLASHITGGFPQHTDDVINAIAKTSGSVSLSSGSVQSQLQELLAYINTTSVFTGLNDTPSSYSGQGGKGLRVNAGGTAVEFFTLAFTALSDTPASLTADKTVRVDVAGSSLEFSDDTFEISGYSGKFFWTNWKICKSKCWRNSFGIFYSCC